MKIIPAIDLKDGKCVRLYKGDFTTAHEVAASPFDTADAFISLGANAIHMVDLDGAQSGLYKNREIIKEIARKYPQTIQTGGGIRDMDSVDELLSTGVKNVILGSAAMHDEAFLLAALNKYGDKVFVGIDASGGFVATHGWVQKSQVKATDFAKEIAGLGVKTIIYTDISKDGMLSGPNLEEIAKIQDAAKIGVIASGGISSLDDLRALKDIGVMEAIVGKAIYTGDVSLKDAINFFT